MKNKLRELRAAKEWSQEELANRLGVSRQTINAILGLLMPYDAMPFG